MSSTGQGETRDSAVSVPGAARKRAAIETYSRHERALRRTARRYSLCADDADDALQRALEILLLKAPSEDPRELIRWTHTVVKHEALAVKGERERILSGPAANTPEPGREDWVAMLPTPDDGPAERAERNEAIARSREALQTLKPQERRALGLLAEGYSYREIGEITGFSQTKINRCLAEGREKFRRVLAGSQDGSRCEELRPLLSAFCDDEASSEDATVLREHLRACANCRGTLRAYRAAPGAAALAPALGLSRSLFDRAHDALAGLAARFGGAAGGGDSTLTQVAASGGTGGIGVAALTKAIAICAAGAGGAVACVATGIVPAPAEIGRDRVEAPALERTIAPAIATEWADESGVEYETAPPPRGPEPPSPAPHHDPPAAEATPAPAPETSAGAAEYAPEPQPVATPEPSGENGSASAAAGSAAGEFGP